MTRHAASPAGSKTGRTNPLDAIRAAEAHAASLVLQARQNAEQQITDARHDAMRCIEDARAGGQQAGRERHAHLLQQAQAEADAMVASAHDAARQLAGQGEAHLDEAAAWALALVLGEFWPGAQHTPAQPDQESIAAHGTNPASQRNTT